MIGAVGWMVLFETGMAEGGEVNSRWSQSQLQKEPIDSIFVCILLPATRTKLSLRRRKQTFSRLAGSKKAGGLGGMETVFGGTVPHLS